MLDQETLQSSGIRNLSFSSSKEAFVQCLQRTRGLTDEEDFARCINRALSVLE